MFYKIIILILCAIAVWIGGYLSHDLNLSASHEVVSEEIRLKIPTTRADLRKRMLMNVCERSMLEEQQKWPEFLKSDLARKPAPEREKKTK